MVDLNFFDSIINFFTMLWDFISNLISGIITLLSVLVNAVVIPPLLVGFVPGIIGSCILAVAAIGVAKLIAGWGNK